MRVRVRSNEDGQISVEDADTGERIKHVQRVELTLTPVHEVAATLYLNRLEFDVTYDANVVESQHILYDTQNTDSIDRAIAILVMRRQELTRRA